MASIGSIANAASNIVNTLFDQGVKLFYSIRDFYNFIKKRLNAPMPMRHFSIVCIPLIFTQTGTDMPKVWKYIFKETNLARFSLLAQNFRLPAVGFTPNMIITTERGKYVLSPDKPFTGDSNTITIYFLLTAKPFIETFIAPWCYLCLRSENYEGENLLYANAFLSFSTNPTGLIKDAINAYNNWTSKDKGKKNTPLSQYPCPKLTLDIKYYRADEIAGLEFLMNPNYVYRITGVYPIKFNPPEATHGISNETAIKRSVTFAYNNIVCLPNAYYLLMLFNGGHTAFMYKNQSPVQILNSLNSAVGDVKNIANQISSI